jgi:hypothetical protein
MRFKIGDIVKVKSKYNHMTYFGKVIEPYPSNTDCILISWIALRNNNQFIKTHNTQARIQEMSLLKRATPKQILKVTACLV